MNLNASITGIKVFLVEDYAPIRERVGLLIGASTGAQIVGEADEPAAALAGIRALRPDVVVIDLQLKSGTSGLTILKWLREHEHEHDIAAVVLSNSTYAQMRQVCLDLGARFVLDKATDIMRIGDIVRAAANRADPADGSVQAGG
jgi:DNA-binding NarL/FixJ family response regulator